MRNKEKKSDGVVAEKVEGEKGDEEMVKKKRWWGDQL